MAPVDAFVKVTPNGTRPMVGPPVNAAAGGNAAEPVTWFVVFPPLLVVKTTLLLNADTFVGAKRTTMLVVANPERLKGVPERMVNGPPLMLAPPPVSAAPPWFVIMKDACALDPTAV